MILSAHQPAYLPWLGYFEKISRSDVFIYLDSVQFEKGSFTNRNKIKTPQGAIWLTVPVNLQGHSESTINDTHMDNRQNWGEKHLKSIYLNYKKAPRFDECYPRLEKLYAKKYDMFADMCFDHLLFWLEELGMKKEIIRSSRLDINSKKSQLVLDLCKHFKADHYLSGALGINYLDEESFKQNGIEVEYQNYKHPQYAQLHGEFLPYMSIVDLWMNAEVDSTFFRR